MCVRPPVHDHVFIQAQSSPTFDSASQRYVYSAGSYITFACEQGYVKDWDSPDSTIYCNPSGAWSNPPITCRLR